MKNGKIEIQAIDYQLAGLWALLAIFITRLLLQDLKNHYQHSEAYKNYPKQFFICLLIQLGCSFSYGTDVFHANWSPATFTLWLVINMICFTVYLFGLYEYVID